jgi:myosin-18
LFRAKYERVMKELDYTKKRLGQQHEDDMEQLMALKKQLEKKVIMLFPLFESVCTYAGQIVSICACPLYEMCLAEHREDSIYG